MENYSFTDATYVNTEIGSVVRMKSGGPLMTKSHSSSTTEAEFMWFDAENKLNIAIFPYRALLIAIKQ